MTEIEMSGSRFGGSAARSDALKDVKAMRHRRVVSRKVKIAFDLRFVER